MTGKVRINSLSTKLVMFISGLTMLVIGISAAIFLSVYHRALKKSAIRSSEQSISQTANTVGIFYDNMKADLDLILEELARAETLEESRLAMEMMVKLRSDLTAVLIYDRSGKILDYASQEEELKTDISQNLSFDPDLFSRRSIYYVTDPHVQNLFEGSYPWVVTIAKKANHTLYPGEIYVAIDIRFSGIASYIDNVGIGQHGYSYIMDLSGEIVYHPQQQLIFLGLKAEDTQAVEALGEGIHEKDGVIYGMQTIENSKWRVVGVSYTSDLIAAQIKELLVTMAWIWIAVFVFALLTSVYFSRMILTPVRQLIRAMEDFERNAESYRYQPVDGVYEIQILAESFAHMVDRVQQLVEKVKSEEITLRKTELRALQAQINPHFLYNTLDSIQWMCEQGRAKEAVTMVGALAKLFRISISKGRELIPIRDEVSHAQSYLIIQSFRYRNQFTYEFEVDEEVSDYLCNKITLQPILENAIYHGVDRMVDEGEIRVTVKDEGDQILFEVHDNGAGMSPEQCANILKKEVGSQKGIGLKNVNDRIRIYFGEEYGVQVESELDEGTTIRIRFPKVKEGEYETK